jgi:purine-binding chemotaxis protein CheW
VAVFDELTIVPRGPAHLVGVANLRGAVMPIVDVRRLLGLPASPPGRSITALVIEEDAVRVAVIIEAALGIEPFPRIIPPERAGAGDRNGFVRGLLPWGEDLVPLLDTPRMLDALKIEMRRVNQMQRQTPGG